MEGGSRLLQPLLALAIGLAGVVAPFVVFVVDRDRVLLIAFVFATLGFALVLLGAALVGRSRLVRRQEVAGVRAAEPAASVASGPSGEREDLRAIIRSSFGWVWVALGLALIAVQLAVLLVAVLLPDG